jgi:tryptophanyl-tRNA synthetase
MINLKQIAEEKLKNAKARYEFINLPDDLPLDVPSHLKFHQITPKEAVPTLVYKTENGMIAVQKRGDTKINSKKLRDLINVKRLSLVSPDELREMGADVGVVPLVGLDIPYFIDRKVFGIDLIYGGGGSRKYALKISSKDLAKVNNARVGDFTDLDQEMVVKKRILTGDTPTGKLHVGHYVGTLENRVKLQDEYETFIILADLHAFTTLSQYPDKVRESTIEVAIDNLAVGLDPKKVHIFIESEIPEIYELASIYSMLVSHARALRNPTVKDEIVMKGLGESFSLGFVNYPIFQAADITCVGANLIPVGKDQLPHIEQTNEIVDKFNSLYGQVLVRPEALVGKVGKLVGTDGNPKMGKSLNNTIMLSATAEEVKNIVMRMYTDPNRIHPTDPGKVDGNPVFMYHDAFNPNKEEVEDLKRRYLKGKVGDIEVKEKLIIALNNFLEPIRKRRAYYENNINEVMDILADGTRVTRIEAQKTLVAVREAMKMDYFKK